MFNERPLEHPELASLRHAIDVVLTGHEPYPALALDRHWTLVAANKGVAPLLVGAEPSLLAPPVNVLRLSLHPEGLALRCAAGCHFVGACHRVFFPCGRWHGRRAQAPDAESPPALGKVLTADVLQSGIARVDVEPPSPSEATKYGSRRDFAQCITRVGQLCKAEAMLAV